jgi:hypothetical protein
MIPDRLKLITSYDYKSLTVFFNIYKNLSQDKPCFPNNLIFFGTQMSVTVKFYEWQLFVGFLNRIE